MKKRFMVLLLIGTMLISLCACGSSSKSDSKASNDSGEKTEDSTNEKTIYAIFKDSSSVFFADMGKGAQKACDELGYKLVVQNPPSEGDIDKQISLVESAITAKPFGIVLSCIAMDPLTTPCHEVKDAGIPLTCCDAGDADKTYDALYATDCYKAASDLAVKTADLMDGKGKIFLINAVAGAQSCMDREDGFRDTIKDKYPDIEIINDALFCDNDKTKAANQTLDMLTSTNGDIDAVVGLNENALIGAATAITERGLSGKVIVTGVDCSDDVAAYIKDSTIAATSVQNPFQMGYQAVYGIKEVSEGKDLGHAMIDTGSAIVTKDNIDSDEIQAIIKPQ